MIKRLGTVVFTLLVLAFTPLAQAAQVTIDPGAYKGDYNVGSGWIRGGAVRTFTLPENSSQTISIGGSSPNRVHFHIDGNGAISSDSSRITIVADTIHFQTVTVDVDPGMYDGRYNVLGYRSGPATLHFVPAGTGTDDVGSQYTVGNGSWPWSVAFRLDEYGNVFTDSTRIIANGNSITFVTVPIVVDPGLFTGRYNAGGAYRQGLQTIHIMPEGTGTDDFGSHWTLGNGSWPWSTGFDIDTNGNIITDSTRLDVQGNTMTFVTVPVVLDPGDYEGRWNTPIGYISGAPVTMHLMPEGSGSDDFGSRWAMGNGTSPFYIGFELDESGNVLSDSTRLDINGNTMTLVTVPIEFDPGSYSGQYNVDGYWLSGQVTRHLLMDGTGTMDNGARWNLKLTNNQLARFDIDTPCAIIPSETITVDGHDFTVTCGNLIIDTDGDEVPDSSDNCPNDPNADQLDQDTDGIGNVCDSDLDGDGVANNVDNCPDLSNPDQADLDGDDIGDGCDEDADGDSVADDIDNCPALNNPDQANGDGDNLGDACDSDDDNDGHDDTSDNCPNTANMDQNDTDGDGEGDACDGDVDGDSVGNAADACPGTPAGLPISEDGCSAQQLVDIICEEGSFPNHGRYVSCVADLAKDLVELGLISNKEKSRFVTQAARKQ